MTYIDPIFFGVSDTAAELYSALAPGQIRAEPELPDGDDTLRLCVALATGLDRWADIVNENWDLVLDAERTPTYALDYTAQFGGVAIKPRWTEAEKRAAITAPTAFARGTPAAIVGAIQETLIGSKQVLMIERVNGEAYQLFIRTLAGDTPDEDFTRSVAEAAVPGGILLDYDIFTGQTFSTLDASFSSFNAVDAEYDSFDELLSDIDL